MATQPETDRAAVKQLWDRLEEARTGLLSVPESGQHPQPMTHFADPLHGVIWFITSGDTDLVGAIGHGAEAQFTLQSQNGDYHASLKGSLVVYESEEVLDELWSLSAAAWFERGREDPKVTLLRFSPREAAVWATDRNAILVGLKMMRAALQEGRSEPDIGEHRVFPVAPAA